MSEREEFERLFLILYKKWNGWGKHTSAYGIGWDIWQQQQKKIDALEAELEKQQWISVKHRLPDKEDVLASIDVNFYDKDNAVHSGYLTYINSEKHRWYSYQHRTFVDNVIGWKPLPDPPQEDEG